MSISKETAELLKTYFAAAANLYAVISLRKLLEIYNSQNEPISEEDICEFADSVDGGITHYYILSPQELYEDENKPEVKPIDRELLAEHLVIFGDRNEYEMIKARSRGFEYYVPPKSNFIKRADEFYIEKTPEFISVRAYLRNRPEFSREKADEMAEEVQFILTASNGAVEKAVADVQRMGLEFKNEREYEDFYILCSEAAYNTRLPIYRGNTHDELYGGK